MGETEAASCQLVKMRGLDDRVSRHAEGVETPVIGQEENKIIRSIGGLQWSGLKREKAEN